MLVVSMTGRAPVRIVCADWPVIGRGACKKASGSISAVGCEIRVRQHQDGRSLVYACYTLDRPSQFGDSMRLRAGVLVDVPEDIPWAIRRVADELASAADEAGREIRADVGAAARECLGSLPPVDL